MEDGSLDSLAESIAQKETPVRILVSSNGGDYGTEAWAIGLVEEAMKSLGDDPEARRRVANWCHAKYATAQYKITVGTGVNPNFDSDAIG